MRIRLLAPLLCVVATASANDAPRAVVGYFPNYRSAAVPVNAIGWEHLTHLCRAFVRVQADGDLVVPSNFIDGALTARAEAEDVKTLVSVVSDGSGDFRAMAASPTARSTFITAITDFIQQHNYHGVDLDWEFPSNATDRANLVTLVQELHGALPRPDDEISMAVNASNWGGQWIDVPALEPYLARFHVMAYDFHGSWSSRSGHNAAYASGGCATDWSFVESVDYYLGRGVPREKLVPGIPFYGRSFGSESLCQSFTGSDSATYVTLASYIDNGWTRQWDSGAQGPYLTNDTGIGVWTYDDAASINLKLDHIEAEDLGGAMIWEIGQDHTGGTSGAHLLLPIIGERLLPECICEWNGDGTVDVLDMLLFLSEFFSNQPRTDLNGDGAVGVLDFLDFLGCWFNLA